MIIRELGKVVGRLDNDTLELTDVTSDKLQALLDGWRKNGFYELGPPAGYEKMRAAGICGDAEVHIPFAEAGAGMIENKLLVAGYDVQSV